MPVHDDWDRLVNSKWPRPFPVPTDQEAVAGAKRLYRKAMGYPWKGPIEITSGNRHTWIRYGTFYVNPNYKWRKGWPGIVHSISHLAHRQLHPNDRPHSNKQLYIERDLTDYVLNSGWLDGKLKRPVKDKPKPDVIRERYQRLLDREKSWEAKFNRSKKALAKVRSERKAYARRYKDRLGFSLQDGKTLV